MATGEGQVVEREEVKSPARFTGRFTGKLDAKGRIVIPTEFRQRLDGGEVYCFPSMLEDAVQCGPASLVDDLLAAVAGLDVYDEERWAIEEEITGSVMRLTVDDTGRVSLPREFRVHASLDGPIGFAGRGQHFVVASAEHLDARRRAALAAARENRDTLRARMMPSVTARRQP